MAKKLPSGLDAKLVAYSKNQWGVSLMTWLVTLPKTSLQDAQKHRLIAQTCEGDVDDGSWLEASMNAASARAIPANALIKQVAKNPYIPPRFFVAHKGMTAGAWCGPDSLSEEERDRYDVAVYNWRRAARSAVEHAQQFLEDGWAKIHPNRILEPYLLANAFFTTTSEHAAHFFGLRDSSEAEYPLALVAGKMRALMMEGTPRLLHHGEWHRVSANRCDDVRVSHWDADDCREVMFGEHFTPYELSMSGLKDDPKEYLLNMRSVAHVGRVSFARQDVDTSVYQDLERARSFGEANHPSPFEHVGTPSETKATKYAGNFGTNSGWIQLRRVLSFDRPKERQAEETPYELLVAEDDR